MEEQTSASRTPRQPSVSVPSLSRAFLSADDAARYAHEQIGSRRDRVFASHIFRRGDQRYVVSEPVATGAGSLDQLQLYPLDERKRPIYPTGHELHSHVYSHAGLSTLDISEVERRKWSRTDAALSTQMFSPRELFHSLVLDIPCYLSGAEDSLIRLTPDPLKGELLRVRVGSTASPGPLALGLESGAIKPDTFIKEVAATGQLHIVVGSRLWGDRGQVSESWASFPAPSERRLPEQVSFGAVFASAQEAAQDRFSRGTEQRDDDQTWYGFILKKQGEVAEYVATELVPVSGVRDKVFSLDGLFGLDSTGNRYRYPESFVVHSYYYSRQRVKQAQRPNRTWLAKHFIVPRDLFVVVYDTKRPRVIGPQVPVPVYIATQDGALLKYVPRKDTKLFDNDTPNMGLEDIQGNLSSGKLTSTGFVRVVANSGDLRVLHTNACWDRRGVIDVLWEPSRNLERRSLSPVFPTADDAALYARSKVPTNTARTYGGLVLKRADGCYVATNPIIVPQEDFEIDWVFSDESVSQGLYPAGCGIVARYRSRLARELPVLLAETDKQLYLNMFSIETLYSAFTRPSKSQDEYLFGPDGSTIRYKRGTWDRFMSDLGRALTGNERPPHNLDSAWIKLQIHSGALRPTAWVDGLARSGNLQVIVGSQLWGAPRAVTGFPQAPEPQATSNAYTQAISEPACSPVFAQEEDSARYAHEHASGRTTPGFGFILRNTTDGGYRSTLVTDVQASKLAYDRVFPEGNLPYRCVVEGIYLCAAPVPQNLPDDDYRHFFSPMDVNLAHTVAKTPHGYKPIYFSCADGALLRLKLSPFDPTNTLDKFGQIKIEHNPFASLEQALRDLEDIDNGVFKLERYVLRMARAGKLEVLVGSAYWSCLGEVSDTWKPRMPPAIPEVLWASKQQLLIGPNFHHPDDAARYAQQRAAVAGQQVSGYESAILAKPGTYSYCALEPLVVSSDDSRPTIDHIFRTMSDTSTTPRNNPPRLPDGYTFMAGHQLDRSGNTTLAADAGQADEHFASPERVSLHTHVLKAKGFGISAYYYSTPYGALLKYVPTYSDTEKALLNTKMVEVIDGQRVRRLSPRDFITRLANIGELRVLSAADYWKQTGRLGSNWWTARQQVPLAPIKFRRDEL